MTEIDAIKVAGLLSDAVAVFPVTIFLADESQRGERFDCIPRCAFRTRTLFCDCSHRRITASTASGAGDEVAVDGELKRCETVIKDALVHLKESSGHFHFVPPICFLMTCIP